ncbi:MAG: hypothetical protein AAGD04_02820 [Pseudomonadota bacterium]
MQNNVIEFVPVQRVSPFTVVGQTSATVLNFAEKKREILARRAQAAERLAARMVCLSDGPTAA